MFIRGMVFLLLISLGLAVVFELIHYHRFGHFVGYGLHADLLSMQQSIGIPGVNSMYAVQVRNYSLLPKTLEACQEPNDVSPFYQLIYRYQTELFEPRSGQWNVFRKISPGDCQPSEWYHPRLVRLWPGKSELLVDWEATAAMDGLKIGDAIRFRIFGRFTDADGSLGQRELISPPFTLKEQCTEPGVGHRIKH